MTKVEDKPKVVLLQDNPDFIEFFTLSAERAGVEIYRAAKSRDEAARLVTEFEQLKATEQLANFILLLDMNLTSGDKSGRDGREFLNAFREIVPGLMVIIISNEEYPDLRDVIPMNPGSPKQVYQKVIELSKPK